LYFPVICKEICRKEDVVEKMGGKEKKERSSKLSSGGENPGLEATGRSDGIIYTVPFT
jgi:hypothetical protein